MNVSSYFNNILQQRKFIVKQKYELFFIFIIFFIRLLFPSEYGIINGVMKEIREPNQERSIEKKNKIIDAGYEIFSESGYYGANTTDIAKRAGVSTGIVYSYFKDKRDILLCVLNIYIDKVTEPVLECVNALTAPINYPAFVDKILNLAIKLHKENSHLHSALHSLTSSDKAVGDEFIRLEDGITKAVLSRFKELNVTGENLTEKIHLSMNLIQSFSHEVTFDKHAYINYAAMKKEVEKIITRLFEDK